MACAKQKFCLLLVAICYFAGLPSAKGESLTVIIAGFQAKKSFPLSCSDMGLAINATLPEPATAEEVKNSVVNTTGGKLPDNASDYLILYDWSVYSTTVGSADSNLVINPLITALVWKINKIHKKTREPVDLHVIGHSRGAYVACAALRQLSGSKTLPLGFVQLTMLDPQNEGPDGILEANPGGGVDWTRNYYQVNTTPLGGHTVDGALNINLSYVLKEWSGRTLAEGGDHQEVFDWLLWTFAQDDSVDPEKSIFQDAIITRQQKQFHQEYLDKNPATRLLLYGGHPTVIGNDLKTGPIIENFNGTDALFWHQYRGKGNPMF